MRKDSTTAKLTEFEIERNKKISKVRYADGIDLHANTS